MLPVVIGASLSWLAAFRAEPLVWASLMGHVLKLHAGRNDGASRGPEPDPTRREQIRAYRELIG